VRANQRTMTTYQLLMRFHSRTLESLFNQSLPRSPRQPVRKGEQLQLDGRSESCGLPGIPPTLPIMSAIGFLSLILVGFIAGAMNALAGGGSFVTLPALVGSGLSSVTANASSSAALYPGGAVSAYVYRRGAATVCGVPLTPLIATSIVGGCAGAALLVWTPTAIFDRILPWLLLVATVALVWGPRLLRSRENQKARSSITVLLAQLLLGIYAGYFGGAVGLLMMATWRVLGESDIKALNGPRTLLVTAANTSGIALLVAAGVVRWMAAFPVCAGALAGGYIGALTGKRLSSRIVRSVTIAVSVSITLAFFVRAAVAR